MCCSHYQPHAKSIAKFRRVGDVVASAKQICRFFYNHNMLHDEMKRMIDEELIRPNATRFGTMFMFLKSFLVKKDKLRKWMVSKEWKESDWTDDESYNYTEACLTSSTWWSALEWMVSAMKPLYLVLRYADTQKNCTLPGFKTRTKATIHAMEAQLGEGSRQFQAFVSKVTKRVCKIETNTLMVAAAVLDPDTHCKYNFSKNPEYAFALTDALEKMAETPDDAVEAIKEIVNFRECIGRFNRHVARAGVSSMSPSAWWFQFGGEVPTLQKYALRIVSQCVSSSGCERNWSTFALVHTKIRNRLGYDKLHKLVYVIYNLKVRIQENESGQQKEVDPCAIMLDAAVFDEENQIWDWLDKSTDEVGPSLNGIYQSLERDSSSGSNRRGKRARVVDVEDEEIEFEESEDGDEEDEFDDASSGAEDDNNHDVSIDELNANNDDNCDDHMGTSTRVDQDELVGTSTMVEQDIEASAGSR